MTCEKCGAPIEIGDFPFCPHGRSVNGVIGDDIPGGFVQENFGHSPETFYSKKAMARRAKELGLIPMVRNAGPHDKHVPKWSTVDLKAATELVSRMGTKATDTDVTVDTFKYEVNDVIAS